MTHYLAIDVEASGPSYTSNFIPCFGACVVSVQEQRVIARFDAYMTQPGDKSWNEACREHFWKTQNRSVLEDWEQRANNAMLEDPERAMLRFVEWARNQRMRYPSMVAVTDTGFDAGWLNYYLSCYLADLPSMEYIFGQYQPVRDLSSFHMGVARVTPVGGLMGAEKNARQALGLKAPDLSHLGEAHNPVREAAVIGIEAAQIANTIEINQRSDWVRFFHDEVNSVADWSQEHWDRGCQSLCFRVDQLFNLFC